MEAKDYWLLFMDTGAPELYVRYRTMKMEEQNVSDGPGDRPQSHGLQ